MICSYFYYRQFFAPGQRLSVFQVADEDIFYSNQFVLVKWTASVPTTISEYIYFVFKNGTFFVFVSFQQFLAIKSNNVRNKILPMTGFEVRILRIRSDRSAHLCLIR